MELQSISERLSHVLKKASVCRRRHRWDTAPQDRGGDARHGCHSRLNSD